MLKSSNLIQSFPPGIRIVCISDTHALHQCLNFIPPGDILIHSGDFTNYGGLEDIKAFSEWFSTLPYRSKFLIAGNHEFTLHKDYFSRKGKYNINFHSITNSADEYSDECRSVLSTQENYTYLEDSSSQINFSSSFTTVAKTESSEHSQFSNSFSIYGSPWQPKYAGAFNLEKKKHLKEKWEQIPTKVDILVTHSPPHGVLDQNFRGKLCGCSVLTNEVQTRIKPRIHVFGHIHEQHGCYSDGQTLFVNAAICTVSYKPSNKPILVYLPFDTSIPAFEIPIQSPDYANIQYTQSAQSVAKDEKIT